VAGDSSRPRLELHGVEGGQGKCGPGPLKRAHQFPMDLTGGCAFLTAMTETAADIQNLLAITFLADSVM